MLGGDLLAFQTTTRQLAASCHFNTDFKQWQLRGGDNNVR